MGINLLQSLHGYPGEIIWSCYNDHPKIHLSFDDAVTFPQTENILNILKEYDLSATFYILTSLITEDNYEDTKRIIERMKNEGHLIGNHGHNHFNYIHLNQTERRYEIDTSTEILTELLGYKPSLYRPPYGAMNEQIRSYLAQNGYTIVLWNVGNVDWYYNNSDQSNAAYASMVPSTGGIFVFHNDYQGGLNNGLGLKRLIQILNDDYNTDNYSAPFIVPNDPYFPFVSFLECIDRDDVNDRPNDYFYFDNGNNNDNNNDNLTIFILIGIIFVTMIIAFGMGYHLRSKYRLFTAIGDCACFKCRCSCNKLCKKNKNYNELQPLTNNH